MKSGQGKFRLTLRTTVVLVFVLVTTITAAIAISLQYYFGRDIALKATDEIFTLTAQQVAAEAEVFGQQNAATLKLLANNPTLQGYDYTLLSTIKTLTHALETNPLAYSLYLGREDGSLLEVVNLNTGASTRTHHAALPEDRWLAINITPTATGSYRQRLYYDGQFNLRVSDTQTSRYDARSKNWYRHALASEGIHNSDIYLLDSIGVPGRTASLRLAGSMSVAALNFTLGTMSEWLQTRQDIDADEMYIFNRDGVVIASTSESDYEKTRLKSSAIELSDAERKLVIKAGPLKLSNQMNFPPFDYALNGQPQGYSIDVLKLISDMTGIQFEFVNGNSWQQLVEQFRKGQLDGLQTIIVNDKNRDWGAPSDSYISLPFAVVTQAGRATITDLNDLRGETLAITAGWSIIPVIRSRFPAIKIVEEESPLASLQAVRDGQATAAMDNDLILRYLSHYYFIDGLKYHLNVDFGRPAMSNGLHLLLDEQLAPLIPIINRAIANITPELRQGLEDRWLDFEESNHSTTAGTVPHSSLVEMAQDPEQQGILRSVMYRDEAHYAFVMPASDPDYDILFGALVPQRTVIAPYLEKVKLSILISSLLLLVVFPIAWLLSAAVANPIRKLVQENNKVRKHKYHRVKRIHSMVKEIDELSDSMVEMVEAISANESGQRDLIDSFVRLIAETIDEKSPYTGAHCERVPELAIMLADCASDTDHPDFRDFHFKNEDERREFRIAAWLHDCGKITTPEHVVDKGTKLECIYNRIHEVRMRFEVLWRDAEIHCLQKIQRHPEHEPQLRAELDLARQQLQDNFSFVASCNVGSEFLGCESQERLRELGNITWTRYFSDRIGLSPLEEKRLAETTEQLPATEHLLSDKPGHIIKRCSAYRLPPELGIKMEVPEHLHNLGELHNLSICSGTLTKEDRFRINEHMISTIKMLESLPFPQELKNVPRYASTHHETMDGKGYPRRLTADELSVPERILAVADVFEALTASDRPYKKAKTVVEALDIMQKMVEENHIDRSSFELMLREGIHLKYARRFLSSDQLDEINLRKYLKEPRNIATYSTSEAKSA